MNSMKLTLLELKQSKTGVMQRLAIGYGLTIVRLLRLLEGVKKLTGKRKSFSLIRTGYGETPTYRKKIYALRQKDWSGEENLTKSYINDVPATQLQKQFADYISKNGKLDKNGKFNTESIIDAYMYAFSDNNPSQALKRGLRILRKNTSLIGLT